MNRYCWDNRARAVQEIVDAYNKIIDDYTINQDQVILAGASQGGSLAVELSLAANHIPAKGFIGIVPAFNKLPEPDLLQQAASRGLKGYLITGDKDPWYEQALELHKRCEQARLPCKLHVTQGMGHVFPPEFDKLILEALNFVSA